MTAVPDGEVRFTGLPVSPGLAVAAVCLFQQNRYHAVQTGRTGNKGPERERARLDGARQVVIDRLEALRQTVATRLGPAEAEIFVAQKMMLQDPVMGERMNRALDEGHNAESAVLHTLDDYESQLLELDDAYLKERASDLGGAATIISTPGQGTEVRATLPVAWVQEPGQEGAT